jgi:cytochrome P450
MPTDSASSIDLIGPDFWTRPLEERMADFAVLREEAPFIRSSFENPMTMTDEVFWSVTRYAELVEISRNAKDYCSGQGATAIPDMPPEALEFFGGFINMDDPRHARQRGIVSRTFTPKQLQGVLDSVERICTEVVDDMCEQGEVDLVQAISQPFPLLIICDMMGIPRSEFKTVLDATNTILGAGDPEFMGGQEIIEALFGAGMTLTMLMNELMEERRKNPTDDLTSKLVNAAVEGEDMLTPEEISSFFILLAVAGNDTTRTAISAGMHLLQQNPEQRKIWVDDLEGVTTSAVEEIVRYAAPVVYMRRTLTHDAVLSGKELKQGEKVVMFYGSASRDESVFDDPDRFDVRRTPNNHLGFGGPGPHFCLGAHLARRELSVMFRRLFERVPDITAVGTPELLDPMSMPLVTGVKRLPVSFTPTKRLG